MEQPPNIEPETIQRILKSELIQRMLESETIQHMPEPGPLAIQFLESETAQRILESETIHTIPQKTLDVINYLCEPREPIEDLGVSCMLQHAKNIILTIFREGR